MGELEFFTILIKAGSLSAAALEMNLTPPAVSRRLAQLEERLGVRLLNRSTRHFNITPEGEIFLNRAIHIIEDIRTMELEVQNLRSNPRGLLKVHSTLGFGRRFVAKLISEFTRKYPEIEVQLLGEPKQPDPINGDFDIGIRFGVPNESNVIARKIMSNRRFVCASPEYLANNELIEKPSDLLKHNCIVLHQDEKTSSIWRFKKDEESESVKVKGNLSSNDGEIVVNWAVDGFGVLVRAEWDVQKYLQSGKLVRVLTDYELPQADVYVVYPEKKFIPNKSRVFVDFLVDYFNWIEKTSK